MSKLLKYELRKSWLTKLAVLGIAAVAELVFLYGLEFRNDDALSIGAVLLLFVAIGGVIVIGVQSVVILHRDMNTKQGYMLFMTPRNTYQILGAKVLENGISLLLAGAFFFALGMLDISLVLGRDGSVKQLWDMLQTFMQMVNDRIRIDTLSMLAFTVMMLSSWLCTIVTAFFADILSSALLNGKKFNGLLTFLIFMALDLGMSWLQRQVPVSVEITTYLFLQALIALGLTGVLYAASAWVMERYLSV